jgi:hypothetical protein
VNNQKKSFRISTNHVPKNNSPPTPRMFAFEWFRAEKRSI